MKTTRLSLSGQNNGGRPGSGSSSLSASTNRRKKALIAKLRSLDSQIGKATRHEWWGISTFFTPSSYRTRIEANVRKLDEKRKAVRIELKSLGKISP